MIENPLRQLALVLALVIAALASLKFQWLNYGLDLKGGTELIYTVDEEQAELGEEITWDDFMSSTVSTIRARIDPQGVLEAQVLRRGHDGIYIALPGLDEQQARDIENKITRLGTLRMQVVADEEYRRDPKAKPLFDLPEEKRRLEEWIAKEDNKQLLLKDPIAGINVFRSLPPEQGGPLSSPEELQWMPRRIEGTITGSGRSEEFERSYAGGDLGRHVVRLFEDADMQRGVTAEQSFLVEYLPINFDEIGFTGEDLEASGVRPSINPDGQPVVQYQLKPDKVQAYADLSEKYIGRHSAIILDGYVKSAPVYQSRIPGRGQISGFTQPEAAALAEVLKRGSLKVKPIRQSKVTIGPTLGADSIQRGIWSLGIGSVIVLIFMLVYYRLAGIVATIGVLLNVGLVFGAVSFIGATLTLPGLGGLVLTIGMAVDANILIYERIREEIKQGKDLAMSVRHGFDKAVSAILDSNVTTFVAGLVLYNVGVGPIRGFAVTLMIGIATSLFTAFFVSRLIFHYILQSGVTQLRMREWFTEIRINFLKWAVPVTAVSAVAVTLSLVAFFAVPASTKYALDFIGGADVRVVTRVAMTPAELGAILDRHEDPEFREAFKDPQINTADEHATGPKARKFSVKLKVSPEMAEEYGRLREQATSRGEIYQAPYVSQLTDALQDVLVPRAFTEASVETLDATSRTSSALIVVHFAEDVPIAEIRQALEASPSITNDELRVTVLRDGNIDPDATSGRDLRLEFAVPKGTDEHQLVSMTGDILRAAELDLSNPIPDVAELYGAIVGELKAAAIGALILAMFCIVMYIRLRFREYKYGLAAVVALIHDVTLALGVSVFCNAMGWINAELSMSMIAAFLTVVGYSINDTIIIFDRVRENLGLQARLGEKRSFADLINLSLNQTLSRTIFTSGTTFLVVGSLFVVNYGSGSDLEGFAFTMMTGIVVGTYSTVFIASPMVLWLRHDGDDAGLSEDGGLGVAELDQSNAPVPVTSTT